MGKAVGLVGMGGLSPIWSRGGDSGDTDRAVHPQPLSFLTAGTANILGSFFSSYPITGSFGRWVYGGTHPGGGTETSCRGCMLLAVPTARALASSSPCWQQGGQITQLLCPPMSHSGWGAPGLPAAPPAGPAQGLCRQQDGQRMALCFRTAVNAQTGVCTPMGGLVTGIASYSAAPGLGEPQYLGGMAETPLLPHRHPGAAVPGLPHLALLLHPQSGAGGRHHLCRGPHV